MDLEEKRGGKKMLSFWRGGGNCKRNGSICVFFETGGFQGNALRVQAV